jgi:hypothetical protein
LQDHYYFHESPGVIDYNPNGHGKSYYKLVNWTPSKARLSLSTSGYYNFSNSYELLSSQAIGRYSLRIGKSSSMNLTVGFCTSRGLNNGMNWSGAESAYVWFSGSSYLYYNGSQRSGLSTVVVPGDLIYC